MKVVAIAIAPLGAAGTLSVLIERLIGGGIPVTVVDDIPGGAEVARHVEPALPCVLLDLRSLSADSDIEDIKAATELIRRTCTSIPHSMPVAITGQASVALVLACIRAGAGDVIDLQAEGTGAAPSVLQRIYQRQVQHATDAHNATQLRVMIEDLLKDLIRTERRSIDLEASLAAARKGGEAAVLGPEARAPAIMLVEPDTNCSDDLSEQLENLGISVFTYISAEDAIRNAGRLAAAGSDLDLAVVSVQLPGIDGIECVRTLRHHFPNLPAFLMTELHDADLAANAADLGVVGFVKKPLDDTPAVVERLVELADASLHRTREHLYLQRIKDRHERVLARYRSLPRQP